VALTIAGSDSGGGAGVQADLKTFASLGVFGTSALTCLTAQNPDGVHAVLPVKPGMVRAQIEAVSKGFSIAAAKTGMLYSSAIIEAVADCLTEFGLRVLVVDPVMVATSGGRLLRPEAERVLKRILLPRAAVITPNLPEAEALLSREIRSLKDVKAAARELATCYGTAVVVKGGHLEGAYVHDVLCAGGRTEVFRAARVKAAQTHGTGCTFSAALTAFLAQGKPLSEAVSKAQSYVGLNLRHSIDTGGAHRPLGWRPR
jgi:hydroxymethylpyrimidine/phosphomethylpyrimidine kinase